MDTGQAEEAIVRLIARTSAIVLVEGELGVGKTHLQERLRARFTADSRIVLSGRCAPFSGELEPVLEAALSTPRVVPRHGGPVLGALAPRLPELADRLPPPLPPLPDPRADLARCFRALRELFSSTAPTVLLLDDIQWSDSATRAFLRYLCTRRSPALSMVLTYRPHSDSPRLTHFAGRGFPVETVSLGPLDETRATTLAETLSGQSPLPPSLSRSLPLAEGLPYAISALVREKGRPLPTAVRDVHAEQVRLCGKEVRAVLRAAALCADGVTEDELRSLSGLGRSAISVALPEAIEIGLLRETRPNHYGWQREVARRAVHEATSPPLRRGLHRAAASLRPHDTVFTAHHLRLAGDTGQWLEYSRRHADIAMSEGDWSTTVQLLRALLRHAELTDPDRVHLATTLSRAAFDGLDCDQIVSTVREILAEVSLPPATRGELRNNLGILLLSQSGEHEEGYRELEKAVDELRDGDPPLALKVMSSLAIPYTGHRHIDTHLGWLERLDRGLGPACLPDPLTAATIQVNRLTTLMTIGAPEAWEAAEVVTSDTDDPQLARQRMRGCLNLTDCTSWLGHYAAAKRYLTRGRTWSHQLGADYLSEQLRVAAVLLNWLRGDWRNLRTTTEALVDRYDSLPLVASECRLVAGALALEHGDCQAAVALLADVSATRPRTAAAPPVGATAAALLARHHYHRGAKAAALRELDAALRVIHDTGIWVWASEIAPIAVELLHNAGRRDQIPELLSAMEAGLEGRDAPAAMASLALSKAMDLDLGDGAPDDVLGLYDAALDSFTDVGRPYWTATTHVWRDRYLHTELQQDTDDLAIAVDIFSSLGAAVSARRAQETLDNRKPRRRGRPSYGTTLSPRETEVAQLACAGRTNSQIATRLGLSVRTVEQHIAHAMRKTGAASRYELANPVEATS
ncbi:ATP-binding protein [Amycolatopsis pittospori]|uniref:ATP-binding protein n=1 Tax=Amycolatopsis pittospori TaxID=2749434 RepID=UPI0015F095C6|nr:AAA family ATPase [Amycolatopsis pittospori]